MDEVSASNGKYEHQEYTHTHHTYRWQAWRHTHTHTTSPNTPVDTTERLLSITAHIQPSIEEQVKRNQRQVHSFHTRSHRTPINQSNRSSLHSHLHQHTTHSSPPTIFLSFSALFNTPHRICHTHLHSTSTFSTSSLSFSALSCVYCPPSGADAALVSALATSCATSATTRLTALLLSRPT